MDFNTQHNYDDYNDFDDSKSLQSLDQALTQAKQPHPLELSRFTCGVPERIGYKYVTRAIVPFDQIFEPKINSNNNTVRKDKCPTYINSLIDSFRNGIEHSNAIYWATKSDKKEDTEDLESAITVCTESPGQVLGFIYCIPQIIFDITGRTALYLSWNELLEASISILLVSLVFSDGRITFFKSIFLLLVYIVLGVLVWYGYVGATY
jgi:hypothetical protein